MTIHDRETLRETIGYGIEEAADAIDGTATARVHAEEAESFLDEANGWAPTEGYDGLTEAAELAGDLHRLLAEAEAVAADLSQALGDLAKGEGLDLKPATADTLASQ